MGKNAIDEKAYISVETIGTFLPLVFLVVSILSLVNVAAAQARVHYALTQAANAISIYGYMPGAELEKSAGGLKENVGEIVGFAVDHAKKDAKSPDEALVRDLIGKYLSNGDMGGGEYLESVNVAGGLDGLEFCGLDLAADENGEVSLAVEYEIEYRFGALPLPFGPRLKIAQQAKTKAWQGGAGEGYDWGE